jgi:hypothetical protein
MLCEREIYHCAMHCRTNTTKISFVSEAKPNGRCGRCRGVMYGIFCSSSCLLLAPKDIDNTHHHHISHITHHTASPSRASLRTEDGLTTARQILSILKQSVWPSSVVPSQRTADGLTTDRQILSISKQSVWPSRIADRYARRLLLDS